MSEFQHETLSPWGYILDCETLPNFLNETEFGMLTNLRFDGDVRIGVNIPSATEAIRNFCGWHISPNLTCGMLYRVHELRDYFVGDDLLIQLPVKHVTSIEKLVLDAVLNSETNEYEGDVTGDYDIDMGTGLLRVYDVGRRDRRSKIFVKFKAGYSEDQISAIKELTADLVSHSLANAYGVNSETAGGVSISYSSTWAGRSTSTALADDTKDTLKPYKVKGVF